MHWEYTPKISLEREKGRNLKLDLSLVIEGPVGTEKKLKDRANGSH